MFAVVFSTLSIVCAVVLWFPSLISADFKQTTAALGVLAAAPLLGVLGCGFGLAGRASQTVQTGVAVGLAAPVGFAAWMLANCGGWGR